MLEAPSSSAQDDACALKLASAIDPTAIYFPRLIMLSS
jgi:hypothetical protein